MPPSLIVGAGEESRTLDLNLGKVALYQLSYSRNEEYYYSVPKLPVNLTFLENRAEPALNNKTSTRPSKLQPARLTKTPTFCNR
jgi:hypothetical protein